MKGITIATLGLSALALGLIATSGRNAVEGKAAEETLVERPLLGNQELVHGKILKGTIKEGVSTPTPYTFATNYQQNSMPSLLSNTSTYARLVVNAPTAGAYTYRISTYNSAASMPVRLFVNSLTEYTEHTLSSTWWNANALEYTDLTINLQEGVNVLITQWNDWGNLVTFSLPEDLTIVKFGSDIAGVYEGTDIARSETYIDDPQGTLLSQKALGYQEFRYNGSAEYESAALVEISPQNNTKSLDLDLTIGSLAGETGNLEVEVMNTGKAFEFQFESTTGEAMVNIPSYKLEEAGFFDGQPSIIRISSPIDSQNIRLNAVHESTFVTDDPFSNSKTVQGQELRDSVKINGRSLDLGDGSIPLDWSGSGIEFNLRGKGDVVADFSSTENTSNTRFVVEIDDSEPVYVVPTSITYLAKGLPDGDHRIRITKTSEANGNLYTLHSLTVDKEAVISPVSERQTKFLFLGASIVCGNQLSTEEGEDFYLSWANFTSRAYDADFQAIARSGAGLALGNNPVQDIFDYTSYLRSNEVFDKSSFTPDAIFINAGNNDLGFVENEEYNGPHAGTKEEKLDYFLSETKSFLTELRGLYPESKIVYLWGVGTNHGSHYGKLLESTVSELADDKLAFVNLDRENNGEVVTGTTIQGLSGHPTKYQCDLIAEAVSDAYSNLAGIEDPYRRRYEYQSFEAEDYIVTTDGSSASSHITAEADNAGQNWSGGKYAVSLSNRNIADVNAIETRAANIDHLAIPFDIKVAGTYTIQLGVATNTATSIAYALDDGAFSLLSGINSGDWCGGHGYHKDVETYLVPGQHVLYLTAPLTGWINYDYANIILEGNISPIIEEADAYSDLFLNKTGEECESSAISNDFPEALWNELKEGYENLSDEAKDLLCHDGNYQDMRDRYSFIAGKYGFDSFMSDSQGEVLPVNRLPGRGIGDINAAAIAAGSMLLIAGAAFIGLLAKRKGDRK